MIQGSNIKEFLIDVMDREESGKSSHWIEFLRDFHIDGEGRLKGIKGFGMYEKRSVFRLMLHELMQIPYKRTVNRSDLKYILPFARDVARKQDRTLDMDILRQALTVALWKRKMSDFAGDGQSVVIGDGFGVLASLLFLSTEKKIVNVNLNQVILVDYLCTRNIIPDGLTVLAETVEDLDKSINRTDARFILIRAENHHLLRQLKIHNVFNINSMQEMNPSTIREYFDDLRNCRSESVYFYCCNREKKLLPDGTITQFSEYPWEDQDEIILDELCPWNQTSYAFRPPFRRKFDGSTRHRIVKLSTTAS
tara:strand:- start:480 stop:1403 length:924 start_codon:yes stop_codon:yes gene_type:complete